MTFAENLESAKNGNKRAYGMLCNTAADRLYAVAFLVLDNAEDAENAVKNAFEDGFRGIGRINDENHLCAWLSRELTKHIVARLKEYRAENRAVKSDGSPEKDIFCKLGDLDRLVCALNLVFGYNVKEITVITGLKEETVERKLKESDKKLGKDKSVIETFTADAKAPDSLITKEPKVHDLTVEIDKTDDDELISEMERIAAAAEAEENKPRVSEDNPRLIRFDPPKFQENEEKSLVIEKAQKPEAPKEAAIRDEIEITPKIKEEPLETEVFEEPKKPEEPAVKLEAEKKSEPVKTEEKLEAEATPKAEEKPAEELEYDKTEDAPKEIDARTFINVITAQKIKGRDFLKLMGNTRISNEVYREIEQNPNLTKERLIELLEGSKLTSADYYKVLTAIKQRNELISRKEQADKQVLFNFKDKREQPAPTDTRSFTAPIKEETAEIPAAPAVETEKERKTFDFAKKAQPEIKPFMPAQDVEPDDDDDEELELDDAPSTLRKEAPQREKYKGREFFIDDDVYYPGVNNGKIIFCAVCAVLLIAGSFGIRYLTTGSLLPGAETLQSEQPPKAQLPSEYLSDEDIYKAIAMTESVVTDYTSEYYKADASAYTQVLTKDFCETENEIYIMNNGEITVYSLNAEAPAELHRFAVDEAEREFLGFTALGNTFYMVYADDYEDIINYTVSYTDENGTPQNSEGETEIKRNCVTVEKYENFVLTAEYNQDGDYINAQVSDEAFNLATAVNTASGAVQSARETYLPSYGIEGFEKSYVDYTNITIPKEIGYNGFTVIGTLSGSDARAAAVLGGSQSFVTFGTDTCRVLVSDKNKTYEENFRFVGSNLTFENEKSYDGVCFGAEFIGENGAVTFDTADNTVNAANANGVTAFALTEGETLMGAAFADNMVHITTRLPEGASMLYCVDLSGEAPASAEVKPDAVYTEKLRAYGENELLGLSVEADESGNRTGLRLAVYGYENSLSEKRHTIITLDEQTDPQYLRYLYADAEENNLRIAVSGDGYIAVSTVYFDGISEIERILCFKDDGTSLTETTDLLLFDIQSNYRYLTFRGGFLYVVTDSRIITVNAETGKAAGYFSFDEMQTPAEPEEAPADPEAEIE